MSRRQQSTQVHAEHEEDEPSKWGVVLVTLILAGACFGAVMLAENNETQHPDHEADSYTSFNVTLKKDPGVEQTHEGRIALAYAAGIIGLVTGVILGSIIGALCCSSLFSCWSKSSTDAERMPLNPKPKESDGQVDV